ncbi:hypothetical protein PAEPH01_1287 [Pancytospora epiphaga]|nr:hypothetical protein PAEPH01_1287 [Pancytospora epiphaga]
MKDDPLEKIAQLETENTELRNKLDLMNKSRSPLSPLSTTPQEPDTTGPPGPEEILHYLKTVLGFTIMHHGNFIRLRSIYSFCEDDIFEIEVSNNKLLLRHTDYLGEWDEYLNIYVKNGRSYSAFFAAVTLDLFNKKTFG